MTINIADHIDHLTTIIKSAGELIMGYRRDGFDVIRKPDGSPVTSADPAAEAIIIDGLKSIAPTIPIIAEESDNGDISDADYFWMVDPLDGTKEFIKGTDDFAVIIGLVHKGTPIFGMMYSPATGDLYYGGQGIGVFLNGVSVNIRTYDVSQGFYIVGKERLKESKKVSAYLQGHKIANTMMRGSSLKFCLVADGTADLYPRFVPTYEWDTVAAHAMLLAVGGDIIDYKTKQRLQYGKFDTQYLNGSLITGTHQALRALGLK
jgi:3'(2'), 5'-bisphosphate nucleotidase